MTSAETLHVKNFAGIEDAQIELSRMNVFIGPQASGKSVCAKMLFYFQSIRFRMMFDLSSGLTKTQLRDQYRNRFLKYFPPKNWGQGGFLITFSEGQSWIKIERTGEKSQTVNLSYSPDFDSLYRRISRKYPRREIAILKTQQATVLDNSALFGRAVLHEKTEEILRLLVQQNEDIYFIPAGRSFFSVVRGNVFSLLSENIGIDPFLVEFGRLYELSRRHYSSQNYERNSDKKIIAQMSKLLCGTYKRTGQNDFIVSDDGREVALENSSSGQQEILPLALTLLILAAEGRLAESSLFIEEPEAHLYPDAQREIVRLLAAVTDLSSEDASGQYVITTHSPYILSALNNLMYGAQIARQSPEKAKQVGKALGDAALVAPENVRVYAFGEGKVQSIIDPETHLVRATVLDNVSNELAKEFGDLLDIEFEEEEIAA